MAVFNLSHYDLDGVGCNIVIYNYFKIFNTEFRKDNCSYSKLTEKLFEIDDLISRDYSIKQVFITDLSFEEEQFQILSNISNKHKNVKFFLIDHHPPKSDYKKFNSDNLKIIISNKASGTKLSYLFLKSKIKNEIKTKIKDKNNSLYIENFNNLLFNSQAMSDFVDIVNSYDLWLKESDNFQKGLELNELFWNYGLDVFFKKFRDNLELSNNDKVIISKTNDEIDNHFKKIENNNLIFKNNKVLLVFSDKFNNYITLRYNAKIYFIVDISQPGKFSVRLRDIPNPEKIQSSIINKIKSLGELTNIGGHPNAFGFNIKTSENVNEAIEDCMKFSEKIANTFIK